MAAILDPDVADHPLAQARGQLDIFGEGDVAGRLQQADIAAGRHGSGALIVGEGVREQDALALAQLDMPAGGDHAEVAVVGDLVGGEQDRLVFTRQLGREGGWREHEERRDSERAEPHHAPIHLASRRTRIPLSPCGPPDEGPAAPIRDSGRSGARIG